MLRYLHYSLHTERACCDWVIRFVRYRRMSSRDALLIEPVSRVEDFLTHLVVNEKVAASTQNQPLNALVFLYKRVLKHPLENISAVRSCKGKELSARWEICDGSIHYQNGMSSSISNSVLGMAPAGSGGLVSRGLLKADICHFCWKYWRGTCIYFAIFPCCCYPWAGMNRIDPVTIL